MSLSADKIGDRPVTQVKPNRFLSFVSGAVSQALQVGGGLILLPFAARQLAPAELTVWYVFMTIQAIALLIEFGFTPSFARNFNYVMAGAQRLEKFGVPPATKGEVNLPLLANLLHAARNLYGLLALIVAVLLAVGGTAYVAALAKSAEGLAHVFLAWIIFAAALVAQTFMNWQSCVIVGADRMHEQYQIQTISKGAQIVLSIIGLMIWSNVLVLSICFAFSLVIRQVLSRLETRKIEALVKHTPRDRAASREILKTIAPTALHMGWTTLGEFLISRFGFLVISLAAGAAAAASYAIALQAIVAVFMMSLLVSNTLNSRLAQARVAGDKELMGEIYAFSLVCGLAMMIGGSLGLIFLGPFLLDLIGSKTELPPTATLVVMCVVAFFELNMHIAQNAITTSNRVPYLRAVLVTGLGVGIGISIAAFVAPQIIVFVAIQGLVQAVYNFWRWPAYLHHELELKAGHLIPAAISGGKKILSGRV